MIHSKAIRSRRKHTFKSYIYYELNATLYIELEQSSKSLNLRTLVNVKSQREHWENSGQDLIKERGQSLEFEFSQGPNQGVTRHRVVATTGQKGAQYAKSAKCMQKRLWCSFFKSSFKFIRSVVSNSLQPHGLQHARPLCPSPTPRVYANTCPLSQ